MSARVSAARATFADVAATVSDAFGAVRPAAGRSFLREVRA